MNARGHEFPWLSGMAQRWYRRHTFAAADSPAAGELIARKHADGTRVSVVLPALNEADTIGGICAAIRDGLIHRDGLVDELVVVDCSSDDGTPALAEANGATVYDVSDLLPETPVVRGKGEALWRSLSIVTGDLVVWLDSDIFRDIVASLIVLAIAISIVSVVRLVRATRPRRRKRAAA